MELKVARKVLLLAVCHSYMCWVSFFFQVLIEVQKCSEIFILKELLSSNQFRSGFVCVVGLFSCFNLQRRQANLNGYLKLRYKV